MARVCQVSKKRYNAANAVCFSNKKHKYRQQPNLQEKRFWDPEGKRWVRLRVSTRVIKAISLYGLHATLKRFGTSLEQVLKEQ
jgi:large subunit ribosomal protein L28